MDEEKLDSITHGIIEIPDHVGASIGIALFPDDAEDIEGLHGAADQAMYQVKRSGKSSFAFASAAAA